MGTIFNDVVFGMRVFEIKLVYKILFYFFLCTIQANLFGLRLSKLM
jgi:hypothetical protein